ncbi:MAG: hypothetical protein EPO21_21960 [Chloroflexota bacterium]|nr:MAG: hypothetical protein EPO21_21960 [Chloroflexota bacterium]
MSGKQFDRYLLEDVLQIQSLDELNELVGDITPEERALLASIDLSSEPTEQERQALASDFVDRLIERTVSHIRTRKDSSREPVESKLRFIEGLALLDLLQEIEADNLAQGVFSPELSKKTLKVAEQLADLWTEKMSAQPL